MSMRLDRGARLGSYEIVSSLGVGGMGEVYRAKDLELGREVAIKVLRKELASEPDALKRFEREARTASALNHPNITTIHHIGEHEGTRYIAMELVDGKTLRELLSEGPFSTKKTLDVARQIAGGLAKAHAAGIVHRDLKPENFMVTEDGLVKILDFGLAKLIPQGSDVDPEMATVTKATRQGTLLGTVQYMSPEQAAGRALDYRSDQFSFGSILYEMLTGRLAFREDTVPQTLTAIMKDEPEPISKLNDEAPDQLLVIVERCLAKEPDKRFDETKELAAELENVPDTMSLSRRTRRRVLWMAAAILGTFLVSALGLNVLGLRDWVSSKLTPAPIDSIAVLPLQNLSGDPEQEYFADGMTEALMTNLAKIGALKVISRSSIMRYKGTDKSLGEIAEELGVDAIVEGSALRVGNRVRITAQLIDPETDQALWADSYERDLQDVLLLQSEVAQAIAEQIQVAVTPEETTRLAGARPVDPEAYEAYLRGSFHSYQFTPADLATALEYFESALEKDPDYALAHCGVSQVWTFRLVMGVVPPREAGPKMVAAALKAIELDETLSEAHGAMAIARTWYEWDWDGAEAEFNRAIELNANDAYARVYYGHFLAIVKGRFEEARTQIERALELDPLNTLFQDLYGHYLAWVGRHDDAIAQFRNVLQTSPNNALARQGLWGAFHQKGMYDEALAELKAKFAAVGDREVEEALARGYAESGYPGAMTSAAETLVARSRETYVRPHLIASLYARAVKNDQAIEWLENAFEARDHDMVYLSVVRFPDGLREDSRFQDLLRRMKLPL